MLGKVDFISITLMWALIDLLNVNRKRKKWTVLWMGDTRYRHLYLLVKIERIKRQGRNGYLIAEC